MKNNDSTIFPSSGVVYSSGMFIQDDSQLATLSVFYDKVYLPFLSDDDILIRVEEVDKKITEEEYWNVVNRAFNWMERKIRPACG
jgi:hypothetical protein